jgi:hypothetical protein
MNFLGSNVCDERPSIWGESNMGQDFIVGSLLVLILAILFTTWEILFQGLSTC